MRQYVVSVVYPDTLETIVEFMVSAISEKEAERKVKKLLSAVKIEAREKM